MKQGDYIELAYGNHALQTMDLYMPQDKNGKVPVIVLIHGGGFYCCDKRDFHIEPAKHMVEAGFAVVAVNYRMAPEISYPTPLEDIELAIRWIEEQGEEYGINSNHICLYGTSAGGNLAATVGIALWKKEKRICPIALICPLIKLSTVEQELQEDGIASKEKIEEVIKIRTLYLRNQASNVADVDLEIQELQNVELPIYIQHGTKDTLISVKQSIHFYNKLKTANWSHLVLELVEGADHAGASMEFYEMEYVNRICKYFLKFCR